MTIASTFARGQDAENSKRYSLSTSTNGKRLEWRKRVRTKQSARFTSITIPSNSTRALDAETSKTFEQLYESVFSMDHVQMKVVSSPDRLTNLIYLTPRYGNVNRINKLPSMTLALV